MADENMGNRNSSQVSKQIQKTHEKVLRSTASNGTASSSHVDCIREFASTSKCCGSHYPLSEIVDVLTELAQIVTQRRLYRSIDHSSSPQEQTHILSIPNEILSQIFQKYFSPLELCLVRSVCTRFSAVASGVLETGFKNVVRDISRTMEDVQQKLTTEPVADFAQTCNYSFKTVSLLQTYSILEIILSDLTILKAVTGDQMCEAYMFSPTAYLLEKSSQILRMLQNHYRENPDSCPPLCTVDQLSTACKHFLNMYEDHGRFPDGESPYFGIKMLNILECCINAESQLKIWCEGVRCYVKGSYNLREQDIPPPDENTGSILMLWLQEFRIAVQEGNADFIHWKNTEAKINALTKGSLGDWLKELLSNKNSVTTEDVAGEHIHVRRDVPANWRMNALTKIEFELECPISEAPACARKYFVGTDLDNNSSEREMTGRFKWNCTCNLKYNKDGES